MSASIQSSPDGRVTIKTPRLLLRAAQDSDLEALHLCFSDPEVMRYWSTLPHTCVEETQSWLSKMVTSKATNGITDFVIVLRNHAPSTTATATTTTTTTQHNPTSKIQAPIPSPTPTPVIGKIGIYTAPTPSQTGEIGFLLHRSHHRRGLITEALSAILGYLFEQRHIVAITTDVDPRNEASIGVLEKFGFVLTGRAERTWEVGEGGWVGSEYRVLTREAWEVKGGEE